MLHPDDPDRLIPVQEEGLPAEDWPLERLAWYATRAHERANRWAGMESVERFRVGRAIHLAHRKLPRGEWNPWLDRTFTFTRMTAWRAEQLYLRATERYGEKAEEACADQGINDLYVLLGIKKKDQWLTDDEDAPAQRRARTTKRARPPASHPSAESDVPAPEEGGDEPVEPDESDDADERDNLPADPRRYAEGRWQREYAAHQLARIAADSLHDAVARFVPGDGQALRAVLEEVQDLAGRLSRRCEEAGR
jgi:hypothetical protein